MISLISEEITFLLLHLSIFDANRTLLLYDLTKSQRSNKSNEKKISGTKALHFSNIIFR